MKKLLAKIRRIITGQDVAALSKAEWQQVDEALQFQAERRCVYCGCTESNACPPVQVFGLTVTCKWVEKHPHTNTGICSRCATVEKFPEGIVMLRITKAPRRRPTQKALGLTQLNLTKPTKP